MTRIAPAPYAPDIAVHPGATIKEVLRDLGMTQAELAVRMKRPANKLNEIIQGKRQITVETALELELTLGLPADFWLNLEKNYQLIKARLEEAERLVEEAETLKKFPVSEMVKLGWIKAHPTVRDKVRELLGFFGVARFSQLESIASLAPAWRRSQNREPSPYSLAAWLRKGTLDASKIQVARKFDARGLEKQISTIRSLTMASNFYDELLSICASHGVAVCFVPHLPKSYVNGAAYWLNEKPVIQLSLRYRWADIVWFNFFHELGHIILHGKSTRAFLDETFRDGDSFSSNDPKKEAEANEFAAECLIPSAEYAKLLSKEFRRPQVIRSFAEHVGVSRGVVVGRLHHDKHLHPSQLNDLRDQFQWSDEVDC